MAYNSQKQLDDLPWVSLITNTHTHTHAHTHKHTHTQSKAKLTAAVTQVSQVEVAEPKAPQWPHTALQEMDTVEYLLPQIYTSSWVDWSSVSKVSCSRKQQQQHQSVLSGDQACNLSISRLMPWPPDYAGPPPPHCMNL